MKKKKKAAVVLPHVIFWGVWRECNSSFFGGIGTPLQHLKDNVIKTLYFWENGKFSHSSFDVADFVNGFYF